ncbi:hypothetical protein CERSUDRAFT_114430 [Gelatoporia subvermispora B]|uniref:RING-type E3 ubiquitin transferase n=1 Tax=Ceriporiopsis subvermispora (strain B) TaxID=914234 RepID=M2RH07_CERS8|nr:hypothetical protein CERSUDRAFT_114430 [Gelatoporia subvermispora B]
MPIHDIIRQRLQPFTAAVTSNRIFLYSVFSTFAVAGVIANACRIHSNFYSVSIYLAKSSRSVLVLANFGLLLGLLSGRIIQRIFFGPLQPREVERLYDQTWMFVTESLLAFTIFRDEFDVPFVLMFGFLLFVKCFHWLVADRVESMDQTTYPGPSTLFHIRINCLFFILWMTDLFMFSLAVESTLSNGVGGMVLFASEYAILMASALNAMARYTISVIDIRRARARGGENAPPWEHKSMYIFYIELITDFLKLATYLTFFMVILTFYGLPLNIIRDVYLTARSFITRLRALVRYHNATRDMDRRYPDATEAELSAMSDRTCIICREEMVSRVAQQTGAGQADAGAAAQAPDRQDGPNMSPKKLPCGHIFHFQCLRSWLERQQSCPTCRRPVLDTTPPGQVPPQGRPAAGRAQQQGVPPQMPQRGQPGGAGGWLGRLFGAAVQPPIGPGQFPHGDFRQFMGPAAVPPQQVPNGGWAPGVQPPPYYGYPYHPPPPQGPLQQPPLFRGFYGPNGVWQPWGINPGIPAQEIPPQAPAQQPAPNGSAAGVASSEPDTATGDTSRAQAPPPSNAPIATSSAHMPTSASTLQSGSSRLGSEYGQTTTPRDAAALAALRRLNSTQSPSSTPAPPLAPHTSAAPRDSVGTSASSTLANVRPPTGTPSPASLPAPQTLPSATPTPTITGTTLQPPRDAHTRSELPSLIPLYDLGSRTAPHPVQPTAPPAYQPQYRHPPQPTRTQPGVPTAQPPPVASRASTQANTAGQSRWSRTASAAQRAPIHQLPTTLTDAQLAQLDRLTREAIDERLRVLEGVSGAVYRCIEELTRVRSVLPPGAGTVQLQQGNAPTTATARPSPTVAAPTSVTPILPTEGGTAPHEAGIDSSSSSSSLPVEHAQTPSPSPDGTSKVAAIVVEADESE